MTAATHFPLARYRFEFRTERPIRLPDYAGSMLRGAFGHALRQLACMTRQKECTGCPLAAHCAYPAIFAPLPPTAHTLQNFSAIPVPQIIEAPAWGAAVLREGDALTFHHVLVGRACPELPLIILAWRRALARGIGPGDGTAALLRVVHCAVGGEQEIYRPDTGAVAEHAPRVPLLPPAAEGMERATLHFVTPLRLQQNGKALPPARLRADTLLLALARRVNLLAEFHGDGPLVTDFAALHRASKELHDTRQLHWRDWKRYSSRQQQEIALGGVVGTWRLLGPLNPFASLLYLGQWLHIGKETTFGLGQYTLAAAPSRDIYPALAHSCERPPQLLERNEVY